MQRVKTHDGSETFLNKVVNESYHSFTGAVDEALRKFCEPCKIKELAKKGKIKILDICFGLGYNSAMAISEALKENPNCIIEIVGLENDPAILDKIKEVSPKISYFNNFKNLDSKNLKLQDGNVNVKIILGDARVNVKLLLENYFDAIFFDPFSPKTSPQMWEEDFFANVRKIMTSKAILATYSCARMVRDNMRKAGLFYFDGPKVGRRGPGTIATKG